MSIVTYRVTISDAYTFSTKTEFDAAAIFKKERPQGIIISNTGAVNISIKGQILEPGQTWRLNAPDPFGYIDLLALRIEWPAGSSTVTMQFVYTDQFKQIEI